MSLPVVDIAALRDGTNPKAVAKALHAASTDLGFIYISGHGIDEAVFDDMRTCAYGFFRQTDAKKTPYTINSAHRGWLSQGGARMQSGDRPDLKESFLWASENDDGTFADDHPLRGENQWPAQDLRIAARAYYDATTTLAISLMRGFAIALDLPEGHFLQNCKNPLSRASAVYYPPKTDMHDSEQYGVAAHTDFGVLSVLCQDDVGGLEVKTKDGDWISAPPIEGTLVVNVGDLLARWTDGAFVSTPHRVMNRSKRERLSLVLAFDPDPDTLIDARQVFCADYQSANPPITCGDYLLQRFQKSFAYRK